MAWSAQLRGPYNVGSAEWLGNFYEIRDSCRGDNWTDEAIAAMVGCMQTESGLNPWRWQNDSVAADYSNGYGLVQFTPATGYIYLSGATPSLSTTHATPGATPEDGARQMTAIINNNPAKWIGYCWRDYWSKVTYYDLWQYAQEVEATWGDGTRVSYRQFKSCTDLNAAVLMWGAAYEGAKVPIYDEQLRIATIVYEQYMGGIVPPTPTPPPPTPTPPGMLNPLLIAILKHAADVMRFM